MTGDAPHLSGLRQEFHPGGGSPDIIRSLARRKWLILVAMLIGAVAGLVMAKFTERAWRSEVVLVISKGDEEGGALSGLGNELGGISALAGIGPMDAARTEYLATLKSAGLARTYLLQGSVAADFCKADIIKCAKFGPWKDGPPEELLYRMTRKFQRSVLDVEEDKLTGLIKVSVTWVDRERAAEWANGIVALANKWLQTRAEDEARRRLKYLSDSVVQTDLVPLRDAASRLMESQVRSEMLAETRPDYGFRIIDPARPSAAYDYVKPRRAVMVAGGAVIGFVLIAMWTIAWPKREKTAG